LLDAERGGFQLLAPSESSESQQLYLPSTAILRTNFRLSGSRFLTIRDFMPIFPDAQPSTSSMIVRVVEASGGPIEVRAALDPRFDFGRRATTWTRSGNRWLGRSTAGTLTCVPGWPVETVDQTLGGSTVLKDKERRVFEIYWGTSRPTLEDPLDMLRRTERFWTTWVHPPTSPIHLLAGKWHPWIERSEVVLKLLSRADTGAFIAAPTTSLPEWPGGSRNWDYRYVWIRDAAFAAQSLLLMGHVAEARSFLHWILGILQRSAGRQGLRVVYGAHGETDFEEREVDNLSGYLDSRPVRVGNSAADQFQLDIYGELLDAALLLFEIESDALDGSWPALEGLAERVLRLWRRPDRGIWEIRAPPAHYVHSKVMAWVALDRAVTLGRQFGSQEQVGRWERERDRIREVVLVRGFDTRRGTFVQSFERHAIDAANLRISIVGFLPPDDPRVAGTVLRVERELADGPFVYRYRASDGVGGPEGAFLPCSFWLVDCLARAGETRRARQSFDTLLRAASPLGLFSEEYDPVAGIPLGNYPQAFSHIALVRAALALGLSGVPQSILQNYPWLAHATWRKQSVSTRPIPLTASPRGRS